MCKQIYGILINCNSRVILVMCVYFPTDPGTIQFDDTQLDIILSDITSVCESTNPDGLMISGDINCDFTRASGFVDKVKQYMVEKGLCTIWNNYPVDYTYVHTDKESVSTIDHFIVNRDVLNLCAAAGVDHQYSDGIFHSPIYAHLNLGSIDKIEQTRDSFIPKIAWYKASKQDIDRYKVHIDNKLKSYFVPPSISNCTDECCESVTHKDDILLFYDLLIDLMMDAGKHLPKTCKPEDNSRIPGWSTYVQPFKEESMFWKRLYNMQKPNASGFITYMMRSTRNAYHYAIRRVKTQKNMLKKATFLDALLQGDREFHKETRKVKWHKRTTPSSVDGISNPRGISELFKDKYDTLYNSCVYDENEMNLMWEKIQADIKDSCPSESYMCSDIRVAIKCLKAGKKDGVYDLVTENFIHAPESFYENLCMFYNSCICHGFMPKNMLVSTLIPIPKDLCKSDTISDNYRAIALSALFMKTFEYCLLNKHKDKLLSSGLQFAYKSEHSTTQCTWVAKEVVSYYNNRGSDVHACVLDCSKAFDKIRHDVLFKKLYDKGLPPITVRIIMNMYLNGSAQVKWDGCTSMSFDVSNGVKQGSVISPLFFTIYVDELICKLEGSGYGCKLGVNYYGILIYADDIFLLSPSFYGLQIMLDICNSFATTKGLLFNAKKTKCISFHKKHTQRELCILNLNGDNLKWFSDVVHLGHHFNCCQSFSKDTNLRKGQFIQCVNEICTEFSFAHPKCKGKLLQIYGSSFYGSNLWDLYSKEFLSLCKTWNIAIRRIYGLHPHTHCRFLSHVCQQNHVSHALKCRFVKFMHNNISGQNDHVSYVGKVCYKNASTESGGMLHRIMDEYEIDFMYLNNLQTITSQMNIRYDVKSFDEISGEEWKINMINDLIDCINNISETNLSEEEILFLLTDVCVN